MMAHTEVGHDSEGFARGPRRWDLCAGIAVVLLLAVGLAAPGCGGSRQKVDMDPKAKEEALKQMRERAKKDSEARKKAEEDAKTKKQEKADAEKKAKDQAREASRGKSKGPAKGGAAAETKGGAAAETKVKSKQNSPEADDKADNAESLPPLPLPAADDADWDPADYILARVASDPNLPAAVLRLGREKSGDPQSAKVLAELLAPRILKEARDLIAGEKPARTPAGRGRRGTQTTQDNSTQLIDAVTDALAANGTPIARATLRRVIVGEQKTEKDDYAPTAAIRALFAHPSKENDELLLEVLASAERLRPLRTGGVVTPTSLRAEVVKAAKPSGSAYLRESVARLIVRDDTPDSLRALLTPITADLNQANIEAHAVLYESPRTPFALRENMERFFCGYSEDAMRDLVGVAPRPKTQPPEPGWSSRVGQRLWTHRFAEYLHKSVRMVTRLDEGNRSILLAATIPNDPARAMLYEALDRHWEDGTDGLRKAGLDGAFLSEPGFIVVLWAARHNAGFVRGAGDAGQLGEKSSSRLGSGRDTSSKRRIEPGLLGRGDDRIDAGKRSRDGSRDVESYERRKEVYEQWTGLLASRIEQWREQMHLSLKHEFGVGSAHATRILGTSSNGLPFDVHAPQAIRSEFHLNWQDAMKDKLLDMTVDPLFVHYVRIEEKAKYSTVVGYYRRKLTNPEEHPLVESDGKGSRGKEDREKESRGLWMESNTAGDVPGRLRTIHVFITRVNPELPTRHEDLVKLVTEVFLVEINDPRPRAPAGDKP